LGTHGSGAERIEECRCNAGFFGTIIGGADPPSECTQCVPGQYSDTAGLARCLACPEHSSSEVSGSTAVTDCECALGYTGDITTPTSECDACEVGEYKDEVGPAQCDSCPDEATTAVSAATAVTDCLCRAGHTGAISAPDDECTTCSAGTYKAQLGPQDCTPCPDFSSTDQEGGESASVCECIEGYERRDGVADTQACTEMGFTTTETALIGAGATVGAVALLAGAAHVSGAMTFGSSASAGRFDVSYRSDRGASKSLLGSER